MSNFNPILNEKSYTVPFFVKIPRPNTSKTVNLLVSSKTGRMLVIKNDSNIAPNELKKGKFDKIIEIDVLPHTIEIIEETTSKDLVSKFIVKISASVRVESPDLVYENNIRDTELLLKREFFSQIDNMASDYDIKDFAMYKRDISDKISKHIVFGEGITASGISVSVDMDEESKKYFQKIRQMENESLINKKKAEHARELAESFSDVASSVYADLVDGNIDALEAYKRIREVPFRQAVEVSEFIHTLKQKELVSEASIQGEISRLIGNLINDVDKTGGNTGKIMLEGTNSKDIMDEKSLEKKYGEDFFEN